MRIGARHEKLCSKIKTLDGRELEWVDEIRYLGVYIVRAMKNISLTTLKYLSTVLQIVFLLK